MTFKEYKEKVAADIAETLFLRVRNHNDSYVPKTETRDFWLIDVRNALVPGGLKQHDYKISLSGYYITVKSVKELPLTIQYGEGRLYVGHRFFWVFSYERAVENLRYAINVLEEAVSEYKERMSLAEIEIKKAGIVRDINAVTADAFLRQSLDELGVRFERRVTEKQLIVFAYSQHGVREYRINLENDIDEGVKSVVGKIRRSFTTTRKNS